MATNKKSFLLYCDLIHTVKKLPKEKQAELFIIILEYVNDMDPKVDDLLLEIAFEPIKQSLKRDLKKYEEIKETRSEIGRIGGIKSAESRRKKAKLIEANEAIGSTLKQNQANQPVNVNVNVNDINKRKEDKRKDAFNECLPHNLEEFNKFLGYWFEHGTNDRKMRFEKEKSFNWQRRWQTWLNNQKKWEKEKVAPKRKMNAGELLKQEYGL